VYTKNALYKSMCEVFASQGMYVCVLCRQDWFGMMYSFADSKKKSNLMLSIFEPGVFDVFSAISKLMFDSAC